MDKEEIERRNDVITLENLVDNMREDEQVNYLLDHIKRQKEASIREALF